MSILSDEFSRFHDLVIDNKYYEHYNTQYAYLEAIWDFLLRKERNYLDIQTGRRVGASVICAWLAVNYVKSNKDKKVILITKQTTVEKYVRQICDILNFKPSVDQLYLINLTTTKLDIKQIKLPDVDFIVADHIGGFEAHLLTSEYLEDHPDTKMVMFSLLPTDKQKLEMEQMIKDHQQCQSDVQKLVKSPEVVPLDVQLKRTGTLKPKRRKV